MQTLLLTRNDIAELVAIVGLDALMDAVIDGITNACLHYRADHFDIPVRDGFSYDGNDGGLIEWMPLLSSEVGVTLKLVGYHPHNPVRHKLPTVLSTMIGFDTATGRATSILDATFLTSLRTGAASAVASRILSAPSSRVLGLIGAGAQAVTQLHALSRVFDFDRCLIADIDPAGCASFERRIQALEIQTTVETTTADDIAAKADIICTATSVAVGAGPVMPDGEFRSHLHINAVGSDFPGKTELPADLVRRALVCPDFAAQAQREGECQQLDGKAHGPELYELVQSAPRFSEARNRLTVFDSTGWALEDHVAATILTDLARDTGCGTWIDMAAASDDPRDPYGFAASIQEAAAYTRKRSA